MQFVDQKGNRLVALIPADTVNLSDYTPLTHSLVVCKKEHAILFVFNNWKKQWELPGGIIEAGESAEKCAFRELEEETHQRPERLGFHAIVEWRLGQDQRQEYGALYVCEMWSDAKKIDTEEIGATRYWNLIDDIGTVAQLDITLSQLVLNSGHMS